MSLDQFSALRQRVNYLIGDTSATTTGIIDSHINASILDICNAYPFSWNITSASTAISGSSPEYTFNLAADYNPKWHLHDARIVGTGVGDDHVFDEVVINDRDAYGTSSYIWWPTYDTTNHVYVFNTKTSSGTVKYYYYFKPPTLSATTDYCIVPDSEAVCYLAASKNWITDERDRTLMTTYKQEASTRIQSLWQSDNAFGAAPREGAIADMNGYLQRR